MKIVFLGENDWANTCNRITRAINRHGGGMRARTVTVRPHKFGYSEDVVIERDGEDAAREAVRGADWIISLSLMTRARGCSYSRRQLSQNTYTGGDA